MSLSKIIKLSSLQRVVTNLFPSCGTNGQLRGFHKCNSLYAGIDYCKNHDKTRSAQKEYMNPECKVAIVTGGATGIGYSATCYLLKEKATHVYITGPVKEEGEYACHQLTEMYGEDKVTYICGDVSDERHFTDVFERAIEEYDNVDILFNNAGMLHDGQWEVEVDINITSLIRGTFLAFKYMGKDTCGKGGLVVNNASVVGLQPLPGAPVYSTTKYAVIGTVRNFGDKYHYDRTGIRVVAICPGVTETDLITGAGQRQYNTQWSQETARALGALPAQTPDALGQGFIYVTKYAPSGSVWAVEDYKIYQVEIPDRHTYSKVVKSFK